MTPNDRQVGGTHYKRETEAGNPQHWDLVLMYQWDYFQGQITKYLMRWKTKHDTAEKRLEDLKKASHFLDKYIAHEEAKLEPEKKTERKAYEPAPLKAALIEGNEYWSNEGYYGDGTQLYKCRRCKSTVRLSSTPHPCGCTPGTPTPAALDASWPPLETGDTGLVCPTLPTIFQTGSGNS